MAAPHRYGIAQRFIFIYLIAFVIPLLVFAAFLFQYTYNNIREKLGHINGQELDRARSAIEENVGICDSVATVARSVKGFLDFAKKDMMVRPIDLIHFRYNEYTQIENMKAVNPRISNIRFYMDNPGLYEIYGILYNERRLTDDSLVAYVKQMGRVMLANRIPVEVPALPSVAAAIYGEEEEVAFYCDLLDESGHVGILEVCMLHSQFFGPVFQENDAYAATIVVLDDGNVIWDADNAFFTQHREIQDALLERAINSPEEGMTEEWVFGSLRFLAGSVPLPALRGRIFQFNSLDSISTELRNARLVILCSVFAAAFVLFMITYTTTRRLLGKLKVISSSISQVQSGNLDVQIPVYGSDEIDLLARDYNRMTVELKRMIQKLLEEKNTVRISEMKALQAQIHSHFTYNVLESVRMMAEINSEEEISQAIAGLGNLLRYSVRWQDKEVSLRQEIEMVESYLQLMNLISDTPVTLDKNIPKELLDCVIPKMTIQPLVENCVNHGFEPLGVNGVIMLSGARRGDVLLIEIRDNGAGVDEEILQKIRGSLNYENGEMENGFSQTGIGLVNVHMRLKLQYGQPGAVTLDSVKNSYTAVCLRLPYRRDEVTSETRIGEGDGNA